MSDAANCHYAVLGLTKEATTAEIKKAYRKLALEFHPDKVQGEEAKEAASKKFQKVNEAYGVLSDDEKRQDYDDKVRLMELRKRSKGEANISVPRTPTATHYDVRYAEPRPDTYRTKSSSRAPPPVSTTKVYSQYPPSSSRSYEEDIYAASRHFEDVSRSARRTQSYEEKPSKREDEQRERDRRRRAEDREEKERLIRALEKKEKEKLRAEKELKQKKQRKKEAEEKRSHRDVYPYDDDEPVRSSAKPDKKKSSSSSSSKKHEIRERERSTPREIVHEDATVPDKSAHFMMAAAQYINASRSKAAPNPPPLSRSHTYQEYSDRRSSDTPKSRDKSTHKKSSSGPKEYADATPILIDPPSSRHIPSFAKAGSTPPRVPDSPPHPHKISRAHTMKEDVARSPPVQPGLSRSSTYHFPAEYSSRDAREPRGRDRSRLHPQVVSDDEDSEDDRRYEASRRADRDRRHRTRSPEVVPMPADYPHPRGGSAYRYHVKEGRTVPIAVPADPYYYPEDSSPPSRKSKSATYYQPYVHTTEVRPSMPSRGDSAYSSSGSYMPSKIKTQQSYTPSDVQYSYREPATSWA